MSQSMTKLDDFKCGRCMRVIGKRKTMKPLYLRFGSSRKKDEKWTPHEYAKACSNCNRIYVLYRNAITVVEHDGVINDSINQGINQGVKK